MLKKLTPLIEKYELFLIFFLGIQPLIDVLTTFSMSLNINITFGILIRFFVLFLSLLYIFIKSLQTRKKYLVIYFLLLFFVLAIGLFNNHRVKPIFSIGEEVKFLAKVVYLYIMLVAYSLSFDSLKNKFKLEPKLLRYFLISSLIIGIVMIVSIATSTSLSSYDYSKVGYTGWFYAGNEIGAILAISFPLILLFSIKNTSSILDLYKWIPTVIMIYSMLAVGTKVGYGAAIVALFIALLMQSFELFLSRGTEKYKTNLLRNIIITITIVTLIGITPFTPIYKNTFTHLKLLGIELPSETNSFDENQKDDTQSQVKDKKHNNKSNAINEKQVENLILSSRDIFLAKEKDDFKKSPISQKLLGMGYAGNYTNQPKIIEMDFYDLFYSLGILGTIVILFPLLFAMIKVLFLVLSKFKLVFNLKYSLYMTSLLLAFGIAFTAGHVLTAPAVSIYISAILAFNMIDLSAKER